MTVDARCLIATDLGIVKDGSGLSEDHAQGLGLITYRGTWIFNGILTPARGRVLQVAYARPQYGTSGLLTRFYPRLQVISSSADPFANETTVEVGCQLELMRDRKDAVQYRAIDHPPAWWTALSPARQREVPPVVDVQGVIQFCLDALGIPLAAGSATTSDVKVVEAIDLSGGYVQALDDMLRSSLLIGHITPAGELLVQQVDLLPAPGPVLRRRNLLTLRPINDRGGAEQVVVEFDAIEAPANLTPEQPTEEQRQMRDWELEVAISPPERYQLVYYALIRTIGPGGLESVGYNQDAPFYRTISVTQTSTTLTKYKTFEWTDSEGGKQSQDIAVERSRITSPGSLSISFDPNFFYPSIGAIPYGARETTTFAYEITPDGPRLKREETRTRAANKTFNSILAIGPDQSGSFINASGETTTGSILVENTVDESAGLTKRVTTRRTSVAKTQPGSLSTNFLLQTARTFDQVEMIIDSSKVETTVSVETQIMLGRQYGIQSRPSAQSRFGASQLSRFRDDTSLTSSGTVGSSIGQEEPQVVTAGYRFGGAGTEVWNTSTLRLPYAPDDFITASGTVDLLLTRGRARERALEYGRIQNALDFGHANGVEITTAPWELPSPPLAAVYIEESGVSTGFRVNGRTWEIRNGAMIVTADLCLVGAAGRIIGEMPVNWTPQPAAATALPGLGAPSGSGELLPANTITLPSGFNPAAPGSVWSSLPVDGDDTYGPSRSPASISPPYVQAVQTLAKSRAVAITTELLYSLVPVTETIEAVSRAVAETIEVAYVGAPVAVLRLTPQMPEVYAPVLTSVPVVTMRLTPQIPNVTGGAYVAAPRANLRLVPQMPRIGAQGLVIAPRADFVLVPQVPTVSAVANINVAAITYTQSSVWSANTAATNAGMTNGNAAETLQTGTNLNTPFAYVQMDLGELCSVANIVIGCDFTNTLAGGWGQGFTASKPVEYSVDGTSWTLAVTTPAVFTSAINTYPVSFNARYIRIRATTTTEFLAVTEFYATSD